MRRLLGSHHSSIQYKYIFVAYKIELSEAYVLGV